MDLDPNTKWASFAAHKEAVLLDMISRERLKQKQLENDTEGLKPDSPAPRIIEVNIHELDQQNVRQKHNNSRSTDRTEARADSNFDRMNEYQSSTYSLIEANNVGAD